MCIYTSTCSCGVGYISRTKRSLSKRIPKYFHAWLSKGERDSINSSILEYIMNSGYLGIT